MDRLLRVILQKLIRTGTLRITTAQGSTFTFGDGTGIPVAIRFMTRAAERSVLLDPELKFGEAYMDGAVVIEQGSIADVLALVSRQPGRSRWARPRRFIRYLRRRVTQFNSPRQARRNVAHHYDLDSRSTRCFSTRTGNIAAPISNRPINRSTTPNSPRSAISRPSS